MQANWIGKSVGLEIKFPVTQKYNGFSEIKVFTTRPDTLLGASFIGISPDHPLSKDLEKSNKDVLSFNAKCRHSGTSQQDMDKAEKIGFDTGLTVSHPLNPKKMLPICWSFFPSGVTIKTIFPEDFIIYFNFFSNPLHRSL